MDAREKYFRLFEKASSPRSIDAGFGTIYQFPKFCFCCNKGIKRPKMHDLRGIKRLFRQGFCSEECREKGKRIESPFGIKERPSKSYKKDAIPTVEAMAFEALKDLRNLQSRHYVRGLVMQADRAFGMLSEKLSWLEHVTGIKWYPSKFYYYSKASKMA